MTVSAVARARLGDVGGAVEAVPVDRGVAQGSHELGAVADVGGGSISVVGDVGHPVQGVLKGDPDDLFGVGKADTPCGGEDLQGACLDAQDFLISKFDGFGESVADAAGPTNQSEPITESLSKYIH